jgi:site-specific DNA-cytosine methylase
VRFLSLFSGIEAASHSWGPLGWRAVGFSEIDAFPCALLAHHYPDVPNLGDVSRITREQVEALGAIDLVCGGFPCQDLSVAGKRAGLKDADGNATRSGLFFDAMRVVGWARARWLVVENVPGMLSSHRGRDFAAVVGAMAGCEFDLPADGWGNAGAAVGPLGLVEWRTLDAQFFGLAQRRKRVFLVRDSGDWASRPPVLLEPEGLRGDSAPSRGAGARVAASLTRGAESSGRGGYAGRRQEDDTNIVAGSLGTSGPGAGWRIGPDEAAAHQVIAIQGSMLGRAVTAGPEGSGINEDGTSFTLTKADVHAVAMCLNGGGATGRGIGDADSYNRSRLRCRSRTARRWVRRERGWNGARHATVDAWTGGAQADARRMRGLARLLAGLHRDPVPRQACHRRASLQGPGQLVGLQRVALDRAAN